MEALWMPLSAVVVAVIGIFTTWRLNNATARGKDRESDRLDFQAMLDPLKSSNQDLKAEVAALGGRVDELERKNRELDFALDDERANTLAVVEHLREVLAAIADSPLQLLLPRRSYRVTKLLTEDQ